MRLDYVPKAKTKTPPRRRRRDLGTVECEVCHKQVPRRVARQKLCGRLTCKRTRDKIAWRLKSGQYRVAASLRGEPMAPDQPPPFCPCGEKLKFGSDPMTGVSTEYCPKCGERPLQLYGMRGYDQRARLEKDLRERQESAEAPIDSGAQERSHGRTQHIPPLRWGKGLETPNSCSKFFPMNRDE